jgi:hypothetical protein
MQIRGSPNGARHSPPHLSPPGRDHSERAVAINWNRWSSSIGAPTALRPEPCARGEKSLADRNGTPSIELCSRVRAPVPRSSRTLESPGGAFFLECRKLPSRVVECRRRIHRNPRFSPGLVLARQRIASRTVSSRPARVNRRRPYPTSRIARPLGPASLLWPDFPLASADDE